MIVHILAHTLTVVNTQFTQLTNCQLMICVIEGNMVYIERGRMPMPTLRLDRINTLIDNAVSEGRELRELAELADVSPEYLWKLKTGKAPNISAVILARIAEVLGTTVNYLLSVEDAEPGAPIPEVEFAPLVRRLNEVPVLHREYYVDLIEAALEFEGLARLIQSVDRLSDADLDRLEADVARRGRRAARRANLPRPSLRPGQSRADRGSRGKSGGHDEA
jgi:transcriptional regulator with XRE-family HTH domain